MHRGHAAFFLATAAVVWCVAWATTFIVGDAPALAVPLALGAVACGAAWVGLHGY